MDSLVGSGPILVANDYLGLPRAPETWLLRPLLPAGGAMLLYGDPKVGKSFAAIQLALTLTGALADNWLGFQLAQSGKVVYVQLDTPRSLWAERLETLKRAGLPIETLHLADRETLQAWPFDILRDDHAAMLQEALARIEPIVVIIDTVRESHSGDEIDSTIMQHVVARLTAAIQPAAMILIAHSRKQTESGYSLIDDPRGSSYVAGKMDAIARMTKKGLHYTGRAIEEGHIKIDRDDHGFWLVVSDDFEAHIGVILHDPALKSLRARARVLAQRSGKSEEAARSYLRRLGED